MKVFHLNLICGYFTYDLKRIQKYPFETIKGVKT